MSGHLPAPGPGQLWVVRTRHQCELVVGIKSRESDGWTVLDDRGWLIFLPTATPVRPVPGEPVPAEATWDERVALLAGFERPFVGAAA